MSDDPPTSHTLAFKIATALLEGFDRHYRLFSETNRAAKQRFERADWHGQQQATRERIEFYDQRVRGNEEPAADRVRRRCAADGGLAAGQAALHRAAGRPPAAGTGRDLLQLGDHEDPAPQLLPQQLHLRPAGDLHFLHRARRGARADHLPRLLPDAGELARHLGATGPRLRSATALRGSRARRRRRGGRTAAPPGQASSPAPISRSRCCRTCSSATRAPMSWARSSTAASRRRSPCRCCTPPTAN